MITGPLRTCKLCGADEIRTTNAKGETSTNINPRTGECVDCMVAAVHARRTFRSRRLDPKMRAANDVG